jgi:hypothetical protein
LRAYGYRRHWRKNVSKEVTAKGKVNAGYTSIAINLVSKEKIQPLLPHQFLEQFIRSYYNIT